MDERDEALSKAIKAAGSQAALARSIGTYRQVVNNWRSVPVDWVLKVESVTGVPRSELRPDIYPD